MASADEILTGANFEILIPFSDQNDDRELNTSLERFAITKFKDEVLISTQAVFTHAAVVVMASEVITRCDFKAFFFKRPIFVLGTFWSIECFLSNAIAT